MMQPFRMMLVKLGGSVITDKSHYRTFRADVTSRLAQEISASGARTIIVHGAGSFGHVVAAEHRLQHGFRDASQIPGIAKVMEDVRELDLKIVHILNENGLPCVSIPPSASAMMSDGKLMELDMSKFERYLDLGLTPVTFGDVALDSKRKFGICSGDQLMEALASHFRPERIVFCTDVDGVYTSDPGCDPNARFLDVVDQAALDALPRTQHCADVTGSIYGKLECMMRMSRHSRDAIVINGAAPGRLMSALKGVEVKGSKVIGDAG